MVTLSTLGQNQSLRRDFNELQGQIQKLQTQIGTGAKSQVYGDLGAQTSLDISLRNQATQVDDFKQTINQLQVRTKMMDSSLSIINDTALAVQNAAFQSPQYTATRQNLVTQAQSAIDQIVQRLGTSIDGRNLFGGTATQGPIMVGQSTLLPTVQAAVTTAIAGAPANLPAAIQTAVNGVFATTSNFYTGGPAAPPTQIAAGLKIDTSITADNPAFNMILQGLYTLAALPQPVGATATPPAISDSQFDSTAQAAAQQISQGLTSLEALTAKNGDNEKELTDESTQHDATLTVLQTQINNIENVDLADASTRLSQLKTQLQASYQITGILEGLSLVNYLK